MTFLHPEFLYYTLLPVLVLFLFLLKQKEKEEHFFSERMLKKLRVSGNALSMKARNALFFLVSLLIVAALAQPVIEEGKVKVQAKSADIMVALDISDSMLAEDLYPNRIEHAKQKIMALLERAPQERIGVMAFARNAYLVSPLSFDHRAVSFLVHQLKPSSITEKGTDFSTLLSAAAQAMSKNERKYLLILSDGGDEKDFSREIALAKKEGIHIFVLGIGTEKGAPIKLKEGGFVKEKGNIIISALNSEITALATQSGGAYIESVSSNKDVEAMLDEIVGKSEQRTLAEEEIPMYIQLFYYPAALALLLMLFATSSLYRRPASAAALLLLLGSFGPVSTPLQAGLLDFQLLNEAKARYEAGDYNRSAELYGDYAARQGGDASSYNEANALYKEGDYAGAAERYAKLENTEDEAMRFNAKHNLGNAYAKQGSPQMLQKALEAYEAALALKEDSETRENYEAVKKRLEEQEQEQSQEQQQDKEEQEQQGSDQQQSQSDEAKESQQDKQQEQDSKPSQEQEGKEGEQKPQEQQSQKSNKQESEQQQEQNSPDAQKQEKEQERQAKSAKPEEQENSGEREEKGDAPVQSAPMEAQMSELEAKKWYKMLGDEPVSHIYQLSPMKPQEASDNAKPW